MKQKKQFGIQIYNLNTIEGRLGIASRKMSIKNISDNELLFVTDTKHLKIAIFSKHSTFEIKMDSTFSKIISSVEYKLSDK